MTVEERKFLDLCALRFDGYAYIKAREQELGLVMDISSFSQKMLESRQFQEHQPDNFAAFFLLQRFLGKWGGESLPVTSNEHVLFRLLFLHLYREEVPEEFRIESYYEEWERDFAPIREELAAKIRRTLQRIR
jgi:hypothetical protein